MHLRSCELNNTSVSVIIPAYNSSEFLAAAIDSVLNQSVRAIEIIVVDDGSTDDTKAVCERYPTVKYVYQTNQGVATARNKGIEVSQGNCLIFLDSDDCLLPGAIEIGIGRATWIKFFGDRLPYEMMRCLQANNWVAALGNLRLLLNYDPGLELVDRAVYTSAELAVYNQLRSLFPASAAYWHQQFSHLPELLALPIDRPRLTPPSQRGGSTSFTLDPALVTALSLLSQQQDVPLAIILLTVFKTLLYRYTDATDIVVGMPMVSQFEPNPLINAVAVRSDLGGNPPFQTLLQQVHQITTAAQEHQSYPIELIDGLKLQFTFEFAENDPTDSAQQTLCLTAGLRQRVGNACALRLRIEQSSLTGIPWTDLPRIAKFDLSLFLSHTSQGLAGKWVYNSDLFDPTTIDRLSGHFQTLLAAIVTDPDRSIGELPLLTDLERAQLLAGQLSKAVPVVRQDRCIDRLFEAQVERTPDAIAVVFEDRQLTYRELNSRANQLAHHLQKLGVQSDEFVGICVERSIDTIVGILGILKAGGVYVPLDPSNPQDRLAYIINDAQVKILVTESILLTNLPDGDLVICLDLDLATISKYPTTNLPHTEQSLNEHRLAQIIYTSGSTGQPKGVLVNHANVVRLFTATDHWYSFSENDVWTLFHSFAFDFSVWEIWGALLHGGRLVVVPYFVSRDATAFYRLLVAEQVTVLNQTPSAFYQLGKVDERLYLNEQLSLRLIIFGGEVLNLPSLAPWFDRHGDTVPQLVNMYGITETTVHVTYCPLTHADVTATRNLIGQPIPDLQVYILDDYLQPVPIGISGEMYVGGAGVAQGYWRRAELTRTRFIGHPFSLDPTARLYKTGDLARYLPDGKLEYLRRIDNQVKIRGFRIELGEIEAALNQHPGIDSSIVLAQADLHGDRQLVAYLVTPTDSLSAGADAPRTERLLRRQRLCQRQRLTPTQLREFLASKLPTYMIPAVFAIVTSIPLTVNGKVDRQALSQSKIDVRVAELPNPGSSNQLKIRINSMTINTPKDRTEEVLIAIWSQVLGQSSIGIDDNFFELGGNSILIIQAAEKIKQHLDGIEIPIVKLFQYPTIARLATHLNSVNLDPQPALQLKNRAQQQKAAVDARRRR